MNPGWKPSSTHPFLSGGLAKLGGVSAFLSVSPFQGVYPSRAWDEFEPETDVLAVADEGTPLLWLAMFRPADVRAGRLDRDWEDWTQGTRPITAPVVPRQRAFSQLYASVEVLEPVLGDSVAEHAELMREALRWMPGQWVTLEWLDDYHEPRWDLDISPALAVLDGAVPDVAEARAILTEVSGLVLDRPLPSARLVLDGVAAEQEDRSNFQSLLGSSLTQMVPWEVPI